MSKPAEVVQHTSLVRGEDHVGELRNALVSGLADLDDDLRVVVVVERRASSGDDRPGLTDDLDASGDLDGVLDEVGTGIEVDELASCELEDIQVSTKMADGVRC